MDKALRAVGAVRVRAEGVWAVGAVWAVRAVGAEGVWAQGGAVRAVGRRGFGQTQSWGGGEGGEGGGGGGGLGTHIGVRMRAMDGAV